MLNITVVWAIDGAVAILAWLLVWIGRESSFPVDEPAVVGLAMSVISITTLVGFYYGTETVEARMRGAIAAGFSATYLFLLTSLLVIGDFRESLGDELAGKLLDNFTIMVTTILGFYFGSRALENVNGAIQARKEMEIPPVVPSTPAAGSQPPQTPRTPTDPEPSDSSETTRPQRPGPSSKPPMSPE